VSDDGVRSTGGASPVYRQRFTVAFEYPVCFTSDSLSPWNPQLADAIAWREPARRHRVLPVVDSGVANAWPQLHGDLRGYVGAHDDRLALVAEPIVVPGGEPVKNDPAVVLHLLSRFDALGMDRHSFVLVIGGGAVLDMACYAAAVAHRGLRVVRMPTTVLSQNDSGVGVKNGVNAFGKKNFLGTFAPPHAVVNDSRFLATLDRRDMLAGMAESVKVALIRDAGFFEWISDRAEALSTGAASAVEPLVRRTAELHLAHIAGGGDPFETGSARPLDFGHWAAHKLESMTAHRLRHGEAVAIGIALDTLYSARVGLCEAVLAERVLGALSRIGLPTFDPALAARADSGRLVVMDGLTEFREHLGGDLTITLLAGPGRGVETHAIDEARMAACITELRERHRNSGNSASSASSANSGSSGNPENSGSPGGSGGPVS
jgi:3-dehydroquinate synthase